MTTDERLTLREVANGLRRLLKEPATAKRHKPQQLHDFIDAHLVESPGDRIVVRELRVRFLASLSQSEADLWTRRMICRELRKRFTLKAGTANKLSILDVSWRDDASC